MTYVKLEDGRKLYSHGLPLETVLETRFNDVDLSRREKIKRRYEQYCTYKDLKEDAIAPIYGGLAASVIWPGLVGLASLVSSFSGGQKAPSELYYAGALGLAVSGVMGILYFIERIQYSRLKKQNERS